MALLYKKEITLHNITRLRKQCVEARQTYRRLLILLPRRLIIIRNKFFPHLKPGKAQRLALNHKLYIQYLDEILTIKSHYINCQVKWEIYSMKLKLAK